MEGVIFKVYVVGEYVKCVKRKLLPDVSKEKLNSLEDSLSFSQVSNLATHQKSDDKYFKMMHLEDTEFPPLSFMTDIARGLRRAMNLNLFNFDVIRDTRFGNRYLIIDINYFPGYAKMPGYETVLTDFFCDMVYWKDKEVAVVKDLDHLVEEFSQDVAIAAAADGRQALSCEEEVRQIVPNSCCSEGEEMENSIQV
ncbi:hypothetical protein HRI_004772900 [Hibiscus trionum]|uniref:inositol-1,3,4-trisphosphate 5/6-kinase n=1 Tax=Hibiscus trionum TaxID=183268 RepID=A0A9W7MSG6_HIBTR|nr:hypothetical protein HRI_004772900 [Hibiscus trionum]